MGAVFALNTVWGLGKHIARSTDRTESRLKAFEAMIANDWQRFYRYAYRLCNGKADDAEDLLSETLIDAFRGFENYRGDGFDRWFFRMITNNRTDMARRAKVRHAESLDTAFDTPEGKIQGREIPDTQNDPVRHLLDPLYSEGMQRALDALPEDFRAVILLCDVEQMDYLDIAATLQIPVGTVRSRIHRGRSQMRKTLDECCWRE